VFVDTATLYPISQADLVLRLAELGMFELVWSDHLLAEVERVLVDYKGLPVDRARYFCDCIREAFPSGRVPSERYLPLVGSRTGPDSDDHVHSAAAVARGATVVLSADKRGYPPRDTAPARRRHPDAYLDMCFLLHSKSVEEASARAAALFRPTDRRPFTKPADAFTRRSNHEVGTIGDVYERRGLGDLPARRTERHGRCARCRRLGQAVV